MEESESSSAPRDRTKAAEAAQLESVTDYHEDREMDSAQALQVQ